jgi:hypothetical protein
MLLPRGSMLQKPRRRRNKTAVVNLATPIAQR